jgi:hypothetical protein
MKNTIFFISLGLLFIFSACSDEVKNAGNGLSTGIAGTHLKIDDIKAYLPSAFASEKKIVYTDAQNNKTTLYSSYEEHTVENQYQGQAYLSDKLEVSLYLPDDKEFLIEIVPSASYIENGDVVRSLSTIFMPGNSSGSIIGSIRFDDNGAPISSLLDEFHEEINLNNKKFNDCFVFRNTTATAYSEIYINSDVGVAAFRDKENTLWVFERFE